MAKKKVVAKKRGRPSVKNELKRDIFMTFRFSEIEMSQLEEVRNFLEQTQHLRIKNVKNKITIRDAIDYLIQHGMTYYRQDRRLKSEKE